MQTKARLKFYNRVAHYEADIELIDILSTAVQNKKISSDKFIFEGVTEKKHPRLANREPSINNQVIAIGHLNNTVCASFIKDLYEDFSSYLLDIVKCCAKKGLSPERLIGEHRFDIDANKILALGSWDAVVALISESLFRKLENERSTKSLIKAIDKKLSLKIEESIYDGAMPYLDMRHILVHRDGCIDKEFVENYPHLGFKQGSYIEGYKVTTKARTKIFALLDHIDTKVIELGLVDTSDTTH